MLDFLFGTKQAGQDTTTQIKLPEYMEKAAESLVATAGDVAKEDFIPYTGPRLAGLSSMEEQAIKQAQAQRGIGQTQQGQAYTAATAAGAPALSSRKCWSIWWFTSSYIRGRKPKKFTTRFR